jgi:hypothetical protein
LNKIKEGYLLWITVLPHIPKGGRYTIGTRIEQRFLHLIEQSYSAYFTEKEKKPAKIMDCIHGLDILKYLLHVSWEAKYISHKQYEELAVKLNEVGKMLGGWRKNAENPEKKNRTV